MQIAPLVLVGSTWIWIGFMILVIVGLWLLVSILATVAITVSLPPSRTSTHSHLAILVVYPSRLGLIVLVAILAAVPMRVIGLVTLVPLGSLAIATSIGFCLPPLKKTLTSSHVLMAPPLHAWKALLSRPDWRSGFCGYKELPPNAGHRMWLEYWEFRPWMTQAIWEEIESAPYKLVNKSADHFSNEGTCTILVDPFNNGSRLTIIDEIQDYDPIHRCLYQMKSPNTVSHSEYVIQVDARHLEILMEHTIANRIDLDDITLAQRNDPSL